MKKLNLFLIFATMILLGGCDMLYPPGLYDTIIYDENEGLWIVVDQPDYGTDLSELSNIRIAGRAGGYMIEGLNPDELSFDFYITNSYMEVDEFQNLELDHLQIASENISKEGDSFSFFIQGNPGDPVFQQFKDAPEIYFYFSVGINETSGMDGKTYDSTRFLLNNKNATNGSSSIPIDYNLINNGDFTQQLDSWNIFTNYGSVNVVDYGLGGNPPYAELYIDATGVCQLMQTINGPMPAGDYVFSFDEYNESANIEYRLLWHESGGGTNQMIDSPSSQSMNWDSQQTNITTTTEYEAVTVFFTINTGVAANSYIDNVDFRFMGGDDSGDTGDDGNLILNPGFENWNTPTEPYDWNFYNNIYRENNIVNSGTSALAITNIMPNGSISYVKQTFTLPETETNYRLSFSSRNDDDSGRDFWYYYVITNNTGSSTGSTNAIGFGFNNYNLQTNFVFCGFDASNITICFTVSNTMAVANTNPLYIDDVYFGLQ